MNKNILFSSLLVISALLARSQDTAWLIDKAKVINASEPVIKKANESLADILKDQQHAAFYFNQLAFIGPNLWNAIKDVDDFKKIEGGNITFKVPKFEADGSWKKLTEVYGKLFQDVNDFKKLFNYLNSAFDLSKSQVVNKNTTDKFVYWLCFAKIEEPLLAVQNEKARLIFQFTEKGLLFIELSR